MKHIALAICLISLAYSCKKDPVPGPAGPQGPPGTNAETAPGDFIGKVKQYDQHGTMYTTGLNTTTISITGTTMQAVTDATGSYTLANVPAGTYEFVVKRPGSRPSKQDQMHMIPKGKMFINISVADTAKFLISSAKVKDTLMWGEISVKINIKYLPDTKQRYAVIIFGKTPNIVPNDPVTYVNGYDLYLQPNTTEFSNIVPYEYLYIDEGFKPGDIIYARIYPSTSWHGNTYDYKYEKEIYNSTGVPFVQTFTMTMP